MASPGGGDDDLLQWLLDDVTWSPAAMVRRMRWSAYAAAERALTYSDGGLSMRQSAD
jgi:hypothetical protein